MMTQEHLTLDFDPNLLLEKVVHTSLHFKSTSDIHCGVCKHRSTILREHQEVIHFDEESDDFLDDSFQWSYIHPDEDAQWLS
jgi:hypothetical protein